MSGTLDKGTIYKGTLNKKTLYKDSLLKGISDGGGGNVEFMTSIYSVGEAYIDTGIDNTTVFGLRVKGSMRVNSYSGYKQQIICGYIDYTSGRDLSCYINATNGGSVPAQYQKVTIPIQEGSSHLDEIQIAGSNGVITTPNFDLKAVSTNTGTKQQFDFKIFTGSRASQGGDFVAYTKGVVALEVVEIYDVSGNMIMELKPAIVNGENGMYDTIGQQFYGNANSSGSLVCE